MEEYRGLTVSLKDAQPIKNGIILDTKGALFKIAYLTKRSVFDRHKNEYSTINCYCTEWVSWDEIDVKYPVIEDYAILVRIQNKYVTRFIEGEVYSFTHDNKTIRLGINKTLNKYGYNITNLATGLSIESNTDILKLRCLLPIKAKQEIISMKNNPDEYNKRLKTFSSAPIEHGVLINLFEVPSISSSPKSKF